MRTFFLALFLAGFTGSFAQKAQKALETLYQNYPQEKAVIQFSKNDYLAGETVHFKAYVLVGYEPSRISTNLYAELYDKDKSLLDKHIVPLFHGSGEGFFALPASLAEDVYYVRVYTQYMLNFDPSFQTVKPLPVYNTASGKMLVKKPVQWRAGAFVQGGTLLGDVPATLAVRLFTDATLPAQWQATLVEKGAGTTEGTVDVLSPEVGLVSFLPITGKQYAIRVKDNAGNEQTVDVPAATDTGTSLQANIQSDQLEYIIYTRNLASKGQGFELIGTLNDEVAFVANIRRSSGDLRGRISLAKLPTGVLHLTLLDETEKPLNEQLCFWRSPMPFAAPALQTDTLSTAARGLNHWKLAVDSATWGSYSVQVDDAGYPYVNTFLSDVYLTADLPSASAIAPWYFQNNDEKRQAALNTLLLTSQWSRFRWTELLRGMYPTIRYYPERYLSYTGTVHKGKKLQPNRDINLVFQGKSTPLQIVQMRTDSAGTFRLDDLVFADTVKVYYQANTRKFLESEVEVSFTLQNRFQPFQGSFPATAFALRERNARDTVPAHIRWAAVQQNNERVLREKEKMMEEVIIRTTAHRATDDLDRKLTSGLFSSVDAVLFDFVNENQTSAMSYTNVLEWLEGRVPGYRLERMGNGEAIPYLRNSPVRIYLNEVPVDAEYMRGFPIADIALVKIIRGVFLGNAGGSGNGAIAIYTRRGGMEGRSLPSLPGNILVGYQPAPPVFSPDYNQTNSTIAADQRDVLYRNPLPYPDANGRCDLRFYNSDNARALRLVVTGFDAEGHLVFLDRVVK